MTLGEFRKHTKLLPDDTPLYSFFGEDANPVKTFIEWKGGLAVGNKVYGMDDTMQIYNAIAHILSQKTQEK